MKTEIEKLNEEIENLNSEIAELEKDKENSLRENEELERRVTELENELEDLENNSNSTQIHTTGIHWLHGDADTAEEVELMETLDKCFFNGKSCREIISVLETLA